MKNIMDMPLITQPQDSLDCGICCAKMVLDFDGIDVPYETLQDKLPIHPDFGLYIYEIGSLFLSLGYKADIVGFNTYLFNAAHRGLSTDQLREHIEETYDKNRDVKVWQRHLPGIKTALDFIDAGGTLSVRIATADDLITEIEKQRPVIIPLTSRFLYTVDIGHNEHFAVIKGYDGQNIYMNDPAYRVQNLDQSFPVDMAMHAIHANTGRSVEGGMILKLTPPSA